MKARISSTATRVAGLALLAVALWFSPGEALTPQCKEVDGCQECRNNNCLFIICDDSHGIMCSYA